MRPLKHCYIDAVVGTWSHKHDKAKKNEVQSRLSPNSCSQSGEIRLKHISRLRSDSDLKLRTESIYEFRAWMSIWISGPWHSLPRLLTLDSVIGRMFHGPEKKIVLQTLAPDLGQDLNSRFVSNLSQYIFLTDKCFIMTG